MDDPKSSRKRKRIADPSVDLTGTKFWALRRVLQELRPFVLEVLRTPDFYNSRGFPVIRQGTKQVKEYCKQLRAETMLLAKQKKVNEGPSIIKENGEDPTARKRLEGPIFVDDPGHALVGCSPEGWNFILFRNSSSKDV